MSDVIIGEGNLAGKWFVFDATASLRLLRNHAQLSWAPK